MVTAVVQALFQTPYGLSTSIRSHLQNADTYNESNACWNGPVFFISQEKSNTMVRVMPSAKRNKDNPIHPGDKSLN